MDLSMYLPAVITCVLAFPLAEILDAVIPHATIKDLLDFIFILTIDNSQGWRRGMLMIWDGVRECYGQFDKGEDPVEMSELWQGQVGPMQASAVEGPSHQWDSLDDS
jgi:hypothetical protein